MRVIIPKTVTDSVFVSSTLTETEAAAWDTGTTYAADALAMYAHRVYKSLQASNTGHQPGLTDSAEWWSDQGPTNRWAMFDDKIGTVSVTPSGTSTMTVVLDFGRCSGIGMFGLNAQSLTLTVKDSSSAVIWTETVALTSDPSICNWLDYFIEPILPRTEYVKTSMPLYTSATIEITVSNPTGTVGVGNLVIGRDRFIGLTKYGAQVGMTDWSKRSTDSFGYTYLKPGNWSKTANVDLHIENSQVDRVYAALTGLRGMATVFVGDNSDTGFDSLTVWGFVADFSTTIEGPQMSACTLEIQGLI